jgi:hypothetical protein
VTKADLVDDRPSRRVAREEVRSAPLGTWPRIRPDRHSVLGDRTQGIGASCAAALRGVRDDAVVGRPGDDTGRCRVGFGPLRLWPATRVHGQGSRERGRDRQPPRWAPIGSRCGPALRTRAGAAWPRARAARCRSTARGGDGERRRPDRSQPRRPGRAGDIRRRRRPDAGHARTRHGPRPGAGRAEEAPLGRRRAVAAEQGARLRLHIGTDQVDGRVRRLRGVDDQVLVDLDRPTASFSGDARSCVSLVGSVVAGLTILDPSRRAVSSRRRDDPRSLAALAAEVAVGDSSSIEAARVELPWRPLDDDADVSRPLALVVFAATSGSRCRPPPSTRVAMHHRDASLSAGCRCRGLAPPSCAVFAPSRPWSATTRTPPRRDLEPARRPRGEGSAREGRRCPAGSGRSSDRPAALVEAMDRLEAALSVPRRRRSPRRRPRLVVRPRASVRSRPMGASSGSGPISHGPRRPTAASLRWPSTSRASRH